MFRFIYHKSINRMSRTLLTEGGSTGLPDTHQALMRYVSHDTTPTKLSGWLDRVITYPSLYRFTLVIATIASVCYDSFWLRAISSAG